MQDMTKLKYVSSEAMYYGKIIEVHDGGVIIAFEGRLGEMKLPKRMIISQENLQVGQRVGWLMTYPEVLE